MTINKLDCFIIIFYVYLIHNQLVKVQKISILIIEKLRETIFSKELALKFKMKEQDFTWNRKQPFGSTLLFMFNLLRRSLAIEIDGFVHYLNERFSSGDIRSFTSSVFIQNRKKIDPEVFCHLSGVIIDNFYTSENDVLSHLNGIRVPAVDSSKLTFALYNRTQKMLWRNKKSISGRDRASKSISIV